jgi:hypothetical protein
MHNSILLYFLQFNLSSIYLHIRRTVQGIALFSVTDKLLKWAVTAMQSNFFIARLEPNKIIVKHKSKKLKI